MALEANLLKAVELWRGLRGGARAIRKVHEHRHRFVAVLIFFIPLVAYWLSLSHDVGSKDVAEMQGVPYLLGIPHPTGYPLFVVLGWLWSHAVTYDTLAFRMNLFGAVCMAATALIGTFTAIRMGAGPVTSMGAFLSFAFTRVVWFHGAQADAQDLALLFAALTLYFLIGWLREMRSSDLILASGSFGAALAAHPFSLWLLPCFIVAFIARARNLSFSNVGASVMACALLLAVYAYLPIRATAIEQHPVDAIQMLAPPASRVYWDVNAPNTGSGFLTEVSGVQFGGANLWRSLGNPVTWTNTGRAIYHTIHDAYHIVYVVIVVLGVLTLLSARRLAGTVMLLAGAITATVLAVVLQSIEGDPSRYAMPLLFIAALFASGTTVWFTGTVDVRRWIYALTMIGIAVYLAIGSSGVAAQQRNATSRPLITWVAKNVPQRAIVVTPWADATSLAYAAYADGSLAGRTIVASHPLALASQYATWSKREPVYVVSPLRIADPRFRQVGKPSLGRMVYHFL